MRTALAALLSLLPATALAQTGVESAGAALAEAAVGSCPGLEAGAFAVRVAVELPDDAPDPGGLVPALLEPTLVALRADPRFAAVHLASFGRDGVDPPRLAHDLGYAALLDVTIRRDGGALVIEGATWRTDDATRLATFTRRAPLDPSIRRFVGFPALLADDAISPRSVRLPGNDYVALAIADLDRDGRPEIVAARPGEVHVLRLAGRRVAIVGRAPIPTTVPRAPSPPRRTVGSAVAMGDRVVLRISEYDVGLVVRLVGGVPSVAVADGPCEADRFPMMGGCARLVVGRDFFDQELTHAIGPTAEAPPTSTTTSSRATRRGTGCRPRTRRS